MGISRRAMAAILAGTFLLPALGIGQRRKKKNEEPETQKLEALPEPPGFLTVETKRLGFVVAPMSSRGLLSQQLRDGIKALWRLAGSAPVVKIRAFVAGTGDLRRVQSIVAEMFSEKRVGLPVLSVVQVGALPLEGAQVQLEAVTQATRRDLHPHGLAFISGQDAVAEQPVPKVQPLAQRSAAQLRQALEATAAEPLRISCLLSSLEDIEAVRGTLASAFPAVPVSFVQIQREPRQSVVECEAVGRLKSAPGAPLEFRNPEGLRKSPNYSQVALVAAPRLVLAGAQLAFRYQEPDARLAFQRLEKTLAGAGSSLRHAVMLNTYPLSAQLADLVRRVRFEFLDQARPPASTLLPFEGLPGMDAAFSLEVVALPAAEARAK